MKRLSLGLLASLLLSSAALAHEFKIGDLEIIHPNIPAPAATAKAAGGFMAISNDGAVSDRLIAVETGIAKRAQVHTTATGADGVAKMAHVPEGVEIPAGGTVVLERGGLHVMFMGLTGALKEGDMVPVTLVFEHAGRVAIEFMVDPPGDMSHSMMNHGDMPMDGAAMPAAPGASN